MSIIHPITHKQYNVYETKGREILKKYINAFMNGGAAKLLTNPNDEIVRFFMCDAKHDNSTNVRNYFSEIGSSIIKHTNNDDDPLSLSPLNERLIGPLNKHNLGWYQCARIITAVENKQNEVLKTLEVPAKNITEMNENTYFSMVKKKSMIEGFKNIVILIN